MRPGPRGGSDEESQIPVCNRGTVVAQRAASGRTLTAEGPPVNQRIALAAGRGCQGEANSAVGRECRRAPLTRDRWAHKMSGPGLHRRLLDRSQSRPSRPDSLCLWRSPER